MEYHRGESLHINYSPTDSIDESDTKDFLPRLFNFLFTNS
jgi:hypothetical protein